MSELILEQNNIPLGWTYSTIEDIAINEKGSIRMGPFGSQLKKHELVDQGIRVLWIENVVNNRFEYKNGKFITKKKFEVLKGFAVNSNDVLVTMMGTIGRTCVVPQNIDQSIISSHLLKIRPDPQLIDSNFLAYLLRGDPKILKQIDSKARGVVMKGLNTKIIKSLEFLLPPINEQKRIALKIEELFSLIDFQFYTLIKTKALLISIKKSILKNAFNGNLTIYWRKLNSSENAEYILNKIEKEREKKNLEKFEKTIPRILDLPKNWSIGTLGFLTENYDGKRIPVNRIKREQMKGKYPYYGASGIIDYVNKPIFKGKYLLIGEDGANLLTRSTSIAFIADGEFWVNNHAHILKTLDEIPLEFLSYYVNSISLSEWVTGTAQPKLNQRNMNKIPIPIPPISEQKEIIKIIEQKFSVIDKQIEFIRFLENHLSSLRMSILKHAFEGKLVPQDPNDEPAEILIEKIKQEKQKIISQTKRGKKNDK